MKILALLFAAIISMAAYNAYASEEDSVKFGLNYPATGPYSVQGLDQLRGAELAVEEINSTGGLLGKPVELVLMDTKSQPRIAVQNVIELVEKKNVKMIFGGSSSGVAVAVGNICQERGIVFMATITASNATTREDGHRHTFRVCYNAWMGAKALSRYLNKQYKGKKFFYIVSNYTWGWSSEDSIRKFTDTEDRAVHKRVLTKLGADESEFKKAVILAKMVKPDVLVLVLFGKDMSTAIRLATEYGLKEKSQIVVPILELGLAEGAGPEVMENVIGTADWNWRVPYTYKHEKGIQFIEKFTKRFGRYPCWGAATAYTNAIEYSNAVRRANSFDANKVIYALEGHKFSLLKDEQEWRSFDHQNVQTVYVIQCNTAKKIREDKLKLDYFQILERFPGKDVVQTQAEWERARREVGRDIIFERFPGEKY